MIEQVQSIRLIFAAYGIVLLWSDFGFEGLIFEKI